MLSNPAAGLTDWEKGVVIHALGDAWAHTKGSGADEQAYGFPLGHLFDGHAPDTISTAPGKYVAYIQNLYGALGGATNPNHQPKIMDELEDTANHFGWDGTNIDQENQWLFNIILQNGGATLMGPYSPGKKWEFQEGAYPTPTHSQMSDLMTKIARWCHCVKFSK